MLEFVPIRQQLVTARPLGRLISDAFWLVAICTLYALAWLTGAKEMEE